MPSSGHSVKRVVHNTKHNVRKRRKIAFRDSQIIKTYHMYIGDMTGHGVIECKLCAAELA